VISVEIAHRRVSLDLLVAHREEDAAP